MAWLFFCGWLMKARYSTYPTRNLARNFSILHYSNFVKVTWTVRDKLLIFHALCIFGYIHTSLYIYIYIYIYIYVYLYTFIHINISICNIAICNAQLEHSGPSRSSFDRSCTDELSKSKTAAVFRLIQYYAP